MLNDVLGFQFEAKEKAVSALDTAFLGNLCLFFDKCQVRSRFLPAADI